MQSLPLHIKVKMTKYRIKEWVTEFGEEGVYISFSGGKDSTVLLHLVREEYPNIPAVFVDTGLEYPEIRQFVKGFENVEWLKPKKNFKQVVSEYGYPIISKEVSDTVSMAKRGYKSGINKLNGVDKNGNESSFRKGMKKYKFLLEAPFNISDECCYISKKQPAKDYEHRTKRKPFIATMACESALRQTSWLRTGCNAFDTQRPISQPMAFWTEQDVLQYIYENNLEIASVYGDVVNSNEIDGQLSFLQTDKCFKTTGCQRTGCVFCLYGIQAEKSPNRLEKLKDSHPKLYEYVMKPEEQGGLGYLEKLNWINSNGNMNIKY